MSATTAMAGSVSFTLDRHRQAPGGAGAVEQTCRALSASGANDLDQEPDFAVMGDVLKRRRS